MTINEKSLVVAKSAITKLFLLNPIGENYSTLYFCISTFLYIHISAHLYLCISIFVDIYIFIIKIPGASLQRGKVK